MVRRLIRGGLHAIEKIGADQACRKMEPRGQLLHPFDESLRAPRKAIERVWSISCKVCIRGAERQVQFILRDDRANVSLPCNDGETRAHNGPVSGQEQKLRRRDRGQSLELRLLNGLKDGIAPLRIYRHDLATPSSPAMTRRPAINITAVHSAVAVHQEHSFRKEIT